MNPRVFVSWLIAAAVIVAAPQTAEACSCIGFTTSATALRTADLVFTGTVAEVALRRGSRTNADGSITAWMTSGFLTAAITVDRVFKGAVGRTVVIAGEGTNCDEPFAAGQAWLVYATMRDGMVVTSKCTRTRLLSEAGEDLKFLDTRGRGTAQAILFGDVHHVTGSGDATVRRIVVEPLDVIAVGSGQRMQVKTETGGAFQLILPPGQFDVWIERRGQIVTARTTVVVRDGEERQLLFSARFN